MKTPSPFTCILCLGFQIFSFLSVWAAQDDCAGFDPVLCGTYFQLKENLQALAKPVELSQQRPAAASHVVDLGSLKNKSWRCITVDLGEKKLYVGSAMKTPQSGGKNPKMFIAFSSDGMVEPLLIDIDTVIKDKKFNRKVGLDFVGNKLSLEARLPDNQVSLYLWHGGKPAVLERSTFTLTASSGAVEPAQTMELPVPSFFGKVYDSGYHFNLGGEEVALFYGDQAEEGEPAPFGRFAVGRKFLLLAHKTSFTEYHWKNAIYLGQECMASGAVCSGEILEGKIKFQTTMLSNEILQVQEEMSR